MSSGAIMHSGYVLVEGGRLYYEKAGTGDTVLVFIHGMGMDLRMWEEQFGLFSLRYTVIRYDVRGYGKSDMPGSEPYLHQGDLKLLLDQLEVKQAHFIGSSMGGAIALDFALDYPGYVSSLILSNSALHGYKPSYVDLELNAIYKRIETDVTERRLDSARAWWLTLPHFTQALRQERYTDAIQQMAQTYTFWHFAHRNPVISPQVKAVDRLGELKKRCLVLTGELDLPDFIQIGQRLSLEIAHSVTYELANVGHLANMERPDEFNRAVSCFLEGNGCNPQ
ncbi:3-oxoadipate enol-lactonase 2 [Paenibacillus solanacearum]|uniref:3-oxoadipate enol-lactonase 2 n=1 Tax=Paenibacillus solanacearum TaxID=2048548 RepID=A0A916NHX2_9BACL|nr:alpha/beta fold hydrolase [Paenibacillus solanacearum]CAG7612590.1 3-oxoadipate enol-lactonase 2 [Paenibacillus solanacearum]